MPNSLKTLTEKYETIIGGHQRGFDELSTKEQNMLIYLALNPDKINKFKFVDMWVDDHMFCYGLKVNDIPFGVWWVEDEEDHWSTPVTQELVKIEKRLTPKNKNILATSWLKDFIDRSTEDSIDIENLQDPELQKRLADAEDQIERERLKELGNKQAGANIDF